jgi:hypothetical protein
VNFVVFDTGANQNISTQRILGDDVIKAVEFVESALLRCSDSNMAIGVDKDAMGKRKSWNGEGFCCIDEGIDNIPPRVDVIKTKSLRVFSIIDLAQAVP